MSDHTGWQANNAEDDRSGDEREDAFPWHCAPTVRRGPDHTHTRTHDADNDRERDDT